MNEDKHKYNPYIKNGKKVLRQSIVGFIDILGFKESVKNAAKKKKESQKFFMSFQENLLQWSDSILNTGSGELFREWFFENGKDDYVIRIFSDCISIGCPIEKTFRADNSVAGCDNFWQILSAIYLFQYQMTESGFFLRGAISVGELYMDDTIIYGKAHIDAYEAETKDAKYPRIILTKSAQKLFSKISKDFKRRKEVNWLERYLYKDSDGKFFVNYLESIYIGDDLYQFVDCLEKHQKMIEKNLAENKDNSCILEKYIWVANYHNLFCNQPPYHKDYIIDLSQYQMQAVT